MVELRKVQRTTTGTFFICLPRTWAKQQDLKKGSLVALNSSADGKLILNPRHSVGLVPKSVILDAGPYLSRNIIGRYLLGFDIIRIEAKDRIDFEIRNAVKSTISSLIGLEIVEETYSQIVLQCLLEPSSFPPEKILSRNYSIIAEMNRDIVNSFVNGDIQLAKSIIARDIESNRLYFLLVRILRTIIQNPSLSDRLGVTPIECLDYRLAASLIEGMGDLSVRIAEKTLELNGTPLPEDLGRLFLNLQKICYTAHNNALKAFLNKEVTLAEEVRHLKEKIITEFKSIEVAVKNRFLDFSPPLLATASFFRQIYENSVDLADLIA